MVGAIMAKEPAIVVASNWRRCGKHDENGRENGGDQHPPAKALRDPCGDQNLLACACCAAMLASVKPSVAAKKRLRSDSARVSHPVSGMAMISAIR